jgi:predicted AlkP superfamily phosphohydrolase/phosphomutase
MTLKVNMAKKVIIFGLDGVSENVLEAVGWERLPNLRKLLKDGASGSLESVLPSITAQAWATFATGKNMGKHGAYNFFLPEEDLNTTKIVSAKDIAGSTFYELLEEAGKRCVLINLPVSYPHRLKKGVSIASFINKGEDWFYPNDLGEKIDNLDKYKLFPDTFLEFGAGQERYAREVADMARAKFQIATQLFESERWDFFFLLFSEPDWLQHRVLEELEAGKIDKDSYVIQLYQQLDDYLGWFIEKLKKDTVLLLMSDHGFKVYQGRFNINKWLEEQGYLTLTSSVGDQTQPQVVARSKLEKGGQVGLLSWVFKMGALTALNIPVLRAATARVFGIVSQMFPKHLQRDLTDFSDIDVGCDPTRTKAYSMPGNFGAVFINSKERFASGVVGKKEYQRLRRKIYEGLKKLRDPETGLPAVKRVYLREELYHGDMLEKAPDIICEPGEFWIKPSVSVSEVFWHGSVASHCREGIFAVYDGKLKRRRLKGVKMEDLAPTILKLMGVKVPKDMDGHPIRIG